MTINTPTRTDDHRFQVFERRSLDRIPQLASLPADERAAMRAVASVFPFRVNRYVVDQLIDWSRVPDDPIFQLTFPQRGMLSPDDLGRFDRLVRSGDDAALQQAARQLQAGLNPHPAGQQALNVPALEGETLDGIQHKYRETVLFFPKQGQTCHTYCSYCFRWPQFVGLESLRFAADEATGLTRYLDAHREVTDVLFTGGDPLVMSARHLASYVEPLLEPGREHLTSIRFGSKALAYWPHRFVTDRDADQVLALFEKVVASGRSLAFMAHVSHPRELETPMAQAAIARILRTGAVIRCQAPLMRYVNDDPAVWAQAWRTEVRLGMVPYYLFVARDTGPRHYFEVPLVRAHDIYARALSQVSGLARTVRGPSMSATAGKVVVDGVADLGGQRVMVLRYLQARDAARVGRPFFAQHDPAAAWLSDLRPWSAADAHLFEPAGYGATVERWDGGPKADGVLH